MGISNEIANQNGILKLRKKVTYLVMITTGTLITLIEKKGRDKRLVKNWRPISLMNVDTKIASKVLALRMKKVIPNSINYDQTAHVKGRSIGESIRIIDDMLYHADQENLDGILFAADLDRPLTLWNMVSSLLPLLNLGLVRIKYSG